MDVRDNVVTLIVYFMFLMKIKICTYYSKTYELASNRFNHCEKLAGI